MYYSGAGVALDYSEAARWARKSAEQGYAPAQVDFGYLYEQGKGVPLDYVRAYKWYKLAAAGGDDRGLARMKSLARLMTQKQISEASDRASPLPRPQIPGRKPKHRKQYPKLIQGAMRLKCGSSIVRKQRSGIFVG